MIDFPPKPELQRQQRIGQYGEIVDELTLESEILWTRYIRQQKVARAAIKETQSEN